MIEVILNWHPISIYSTVALFIMSFIFYVLAYIALHRRLKVKKFAAEFEMVARWCLWLSALMSIIAVITLFYVFYTIKHGALLEYEVMVIYRNWAITTAITFFLIASWSVWRYIQRKTLTHIFVIALLFVQNFLLITLWYGGELAYQYTIAVVSLSEENQKLKISRLP